VKPSQLANLVEREIRRELPMLSENAYVSWKAIPDDGTGPQRVFVVGTARDIMDSHVAAAKAAGLHPQSADLRVIAAARAIGEADVVIAGVEDDEAELAIFRDGLPAIVRHITLGAMGGEAEWGRQLAEELTRTLKFYRDTHRDDERATTLPIRFVGDAAAKALRSQDVADVTGEAAAAHLRLVVANDGNDLGLAANVGLALKDMAA
jgi:Tfp pilus assembly PilM family ATPase